MNNKITILTLSLFLIVLFLAFTLPMRHDYVIYTWIWSSFLSTGHPYVTGSGAFNLNAYGLSFASYAYLFQLNPFLPRALFVSAWSAIGFLLFWIRESKKPDTLHLWLLIFLNPFLYVFTLFYGNNEILSVLAVFFAVLILLKKQGALYEVLSGVVLAMGFLFKITPLFLVPFLSISGKGFRPVFLLSFITASALGLGFGYSLFGSEIWTPFSFVLSREPTFLSIFYFLKFGIYPFSAYFQGMNLAFLSLPAIISVLFLTFLYHAKHRLNPVVISAIVLSEVLLFSKVNLPQYYMDIVILLVVLLVTNKDIHKQTFSFNMIVGYVYYISTIPLLYYVFNDFSGKWLIFRNIIGLPTFLFTLVLLIVLLEEVNPKFKAPNPK